MARAIAALPQATADDLAWLQSEFQSDHRFRIPLREATLASKYGCWDPTLQVVALERSILPVPRALPDPVLADGITMACFLFSCPRPAARVFRCQGIARICPRIAARARVALACVSVGR